MEVQAPNDYIECPRPWIFLAGRIEQGLADKWQDKIVKALTPLTVLNPRRDYWDSSWTQSIDNSHFREQVEWELRAQEHADLILMHFDPVTKSPVTLLELGLFASVDIIVHCPEGYWRKGNGDIVCKRYYIRTVDSIEDLIAEARHRYNLDAH